jgi:hypothetical protein
MNDYTWIPIGALILCIVIILIGFVLSLIDYKNTK